MTSRKPMRRARKNDSPLFRRHNYLSGLSRFQGSVEGEVRPALESASPLSGAIAPPGYLDILAAAYAAAGQFAEANRFAKMAVETETSNELRFFFQIRQQSYERQLNQHK